MEVDNGEWRWCDGADEGVVVVGHCFRKHEVGEGVWAEQPKLSRRGSISGALCEMAKGDGVEGWCGGGVYEVAAVVGLLVNARQRGGFGPKSETELLWLGLRRAVRNSNGGWCIEVVWRCVQGGGGGGAVCSRNGRQAGRGFGPKPETEPLWLDLGRAV
jgi:hypothetical protein